jgi:hypothetical protein
VSQILVDASLRYVKAVIAFDRFEKEHSNSFGHRWDEVFDEKCLAYQELERITLECAPQYFCGRCGENEIEVRKNGCWAYGELCKLEFPNYKV